MSAELIHNAGKFVKILKLSHNIVCARVHVRYR